MSFAVLTKSTSIQSDQLINNLAHSSQTRLDPHPFVHLPFLSGFLFFFFFFSLEFKQKFSHYKRESCRPTFDVWRVARERAIFYELSVQNLIPSSVTASVMLTGSNNFVTRLVSPGRQARGIYFANLCAERLLSLAHNSRKQFTS